MASSAVLASCTPAALQRVTPSGTYGTKFSTPAVRVWITLRFVISPARSSTSSPFMYGRTYSSTSPIESG